MVVIQAFTADINVIIRRNALLMFKYITFVFSRAIRLNFGLNVHLTIIRCIYEIPHSLYDW